MWPGWPPLTLGSAPKAIHSHRIQATRLAQRCECERLEAALHRKQLAEWAWRLPCVL